MPNNNHHIFIIFRSVHDAIKAEVELKEAGFRFDTVPVPRQISTDCGIALKLVWTDWAAVLSHIENKHIRYADIVEIDEGKDLK